MVHILVAHGLCQITFKRVNVHRPSLTDLRRWGVANSAVCECGQHQTMNDTVDTCDVTVNEIQRRVAITP